MIFYLNDSTSTPTEEIQNSPIKALELERVLKGVGYMEGDSLIQKPKDFSEKNCNDGPRRFDLHWRSVSLYRLARQYSANAPNLTVK